MQPEGPSDSFQNDGIRYEPGKKLIAAYSPVVNICNARCEHLEFLRISSFQSKDIHIFLARHDEELLRPR